MEKQGEMIKQGEYIIGIAMIVAALLVAGSVWVSTNSLVKVIGETDFAPKVTVQGGTQAAPTPTPTPKPSPSPQPQAPAANPNVGNIDVAGLPFRGAENAKVTIVSFSDFQCPFCSRSEPTIQQLLKDYDGKIKYVFRNFPLSFHENAQKAAEASLCARDQGKFWEMHDKLFANQNALQVDKLKGYAVELGLNAATFNTCLDGGSKAAIVAADEQEGAGYGVQGTPSFFINGEMIVGAQPVAAFKAVIDKKLAS
jgi:protein-disulfide isomerase